MRLPKILLLNLHPAATLGDGLRQILEPSFRIEEVKFWQELEDDREVAGCDQELSKAISRANSAMIFLIQNPALLKRTRQSFHSLRRDLLGVPLVVVTEAGEPDEMFAWLKQVAEDFLIGPLKEVDVLPRMWRLLEQFSQRENLVQRLKGQLGMRRLIGESEVFLAEIEKIPLVAKCDASVLISGETGTGKELCARAIHYLSPRIDQSFIPVNCGAIPGELVENELFGHMRGAFTGAKTAQPGLIQEADGGTLFLDEIDCLPPMAQVKLLRFLQEKEYKPLGGTKIHKANLRVVAATNSNCETAIREGKLRQDLYYRLNVIQLVLPSLRERQEDVPLLAYHFLSKYVAEFGKPISGFSTNALQKLIHYKWPGNVRELEHIIMRAVVLSEKLLIHAADIAITECKPSAPSESFQEAKNKVVEQFEKTYIKSLLLTYQGNISKAARAAHKNRRAFWQLIRKHRISVQSLMSKAP
jgi:DNA-binding NtrC family response regulator